jgi:hypothetical protein
MLSNEINTGSAQTTDWTVSEELGSRNTDVFCLRAWRNNACNELGLDTKSMVQYMSIIMTMHADGYLRNGSSNLEHDNIFNRGILVPIT